MTRRVFASFNLRSGWWLSVILMVSSSVLLLVGSFYMFAFVNKTVTEQKNLDFSNHVDDQVTSIKDQTTLIVNYLYDLRAKLTTGVISDKEWHSFIAASGLDLRYPNFFSVAYIEKNENAKVDAYIKNLQASSSMTDYKNYLVYPKTSNKDIYPVKYIHTLESDVNGLLGYDFGSSGELSQLMLDTSISGNEGISGLIEFNKFISGNNRTAFIIALPVYNSSDALNLLPEERRKFLAGFITAVVTPESLFLGHNKDQKPDMAFSVTENKAKIYSFQEEFSKGDLKLSTPIALLGKDFEMNFESIKSYPLPAVLENLSWDSLVGLITLNVFWYLTIAALIFARMRSQQMTKDATEDLRKFKQAVDGVSDLVVITDNTGVILYANNAVTIATGFTNKEIIGHKPSLWGGQMDVEFYKEFWHTIKIDKKPYWGELRNKKKNGDFYDVELRVWPILDEKGEVVYYVGIERDITKTKAVEKMKTEFISLASHQLRTPLSAVKWFGKMMLDGEAGELSKTQKEYLNKIYESNEREIQMVNSLLNVSRIESGKIKLQAKETNVVDLISSVIGDVEVGLNKSVRRINFKPEDNIPLMMIDPDLLRHVYLNLLTNAVKYTKENGKIDIEVGVKDGNLVTKVTDNGIGIPSEEQPRMFEKFFRGSNALKKETDGNGLGLYLAKTVIESSDGKLWFKSKEGEGTTFWFTIPITK